MIIISYDIKDDKLRNRFAKFMCKRGGIRLQYSVYEIRNTKRIIDNLKSEINDRFKPKFSGADSVVIFTVDDDNIEKFGNAIHRDSDLIIL